jgi:hypothetical protein
MNALLINRDGFQMPVDGWYQVAPLGEFAHSQAGLVQVVDREACVAMANRFAEEAKAATFAGLLVDFDHFSLDGEKRSEAAGWITALENRDGGLFAKIRWSDVGEEAVKGGRYRFLSPVWSRSDCVDLGNGRVRPVRLLNAAVTNDPNLKGMQPLSNSSTPPRAGGAAVAGAPRFKWVLGTTPDGRHCPSCAAAAGQVHTMAEWDAAGMKPGAGGLMCQGNCRCRLEPATVAARGVLADVPLRREDAVMNRAASACRAAKRARRVEQLANTGWTDEARAASLEVRRAKAQARASGPAKSRASRLLERQRLSMELAEKDYAVIYEQKGLTGMTDQEKRYMAARIARRVHNGSALTPTEMRFLAEHGPVDDATGAAQAVQQAKKAGRASAQAGR